jgi:hypothetical protein
MKNKKSKNKNQKVFLIVLLVGFFLLSGGPALAAFCGGPLVPCGSGSQAPCRFCHIFVLISNIINFVLTCLTPIIAALMLVLGGLFMLVSGPNPEMLGKAKAIITATVIGIVIIFIAWVFLNTLLSYMGIMDWTGLKDWWQVTDKCPVQ